MNFCSETAGVLDELAKNSIIGSYTPAFRLRSGHRSDYQACPKVSFD